MTWEGFTVLERAVPSWQRRENAAEQAGQRRAAVRYVASRARDADNLELLPDALGLKAGEGR